jgi:uncharacterized membrane-anchored protein YjiN (DUF445 family)
VRPPSTAAPGSSAEVEQRARLASMKRFATGLLLLLGAMFVAAHLAQPAYPWLGYLRAFTEAAMIGGLADWFAVTALFRHPLGLPIPHTAIIPRQKDALGASLARFVRENFLVREALEPRLRSLDFAGRAGAWLRRPANARKIADSAGAFAGWFLQTVDNAALRQFLRENLSLTLRRVRVTPLLSGLLELLTRGRHHEELVDAFVRAARRALEEHKPLIRERIGEQTPWWLPDFVDEKMYDKIVAELERLLDNIGADSEHPARRRFDESVARFVEAMKSDPKLIERGEAFKREVLEHPAMQSYLGELWGEISSFVVAGLSDADSPMRRRIEAGVADFGRALEGNAEMRAQLNGWVSDATLYLVRNYSQDISEVISDTVKGWDARATSRRVELQVGRDLQFIRVNGTLVGGLVGLLLYAMVNAFL